MVEIKQKIFETDEDVYSYVDAVLEDIPRLAQEYFDARNEQDRDTADRIKIVLDGFLQDVFSLVEELEKKDLRELNEMECRVLARTKEVLHSDVIMRWVKAVDPDSKMMVSTMEETIAVVRKIVKGVKEDVADNEFVNRVVRGNDEREGFFAGLFTEKFGRAFRNIVMRDVTDRAVWAKLIGRYRFLNSDCGSDRLSGIVKNYVGKRARSSDADVSKGFAIFFIDLDKFSLWNNLCTDHYYGDIVLRCVAKVIACRLRITDVLVRQGGEELMVCVVDVTKEQAVNVAEDLRRRVSEITVDDLITVMREDGAVDEDRIAEARVKFELVRKGRAELRIPDYASVSVGVAFCRDFIKRDSNNDTVPQGVVNDMRRGADESMYTVKKAGRDGVACATGNGEPELVCARGVPR